MMKTAEWELINELPSQYRNFISSNLILDHIHSYTITRGNDLELIGNFTYQGSGEVLFSHVNTQRDKHPEGTVRVNDSEIELGNIYHLDKRIVLSGLTAANTTITNLEIGKSELKERYKINSIKSTNLNQQKTDFLIEWISNLDLPQYSWPDFIKIEKTTKTTKEFSSKNHSILLTDENEKSGHSSKCCHVYIQGIHIYFGLTNESNLSEKYHPGYIIYEGTPSKELRERVRQAISFITGNNILYLGCTELNSELNIVGFEAVTPNSMGGLFLKNTNTPPTKLMSNDAKYYILDSDKVSLMIENFIHYYDDYDLRHISWLYWHAIIAPAHLKAVCFGAVLEFTQKIYIANNEVDFQSSLIDKKDWRLISEALHKTIADSASINDESRKILTNKVNNLNSTPQSILTKRFFSALNLTLSKKELRAYSRRNDAAHGNKTPDDNFIELIRDSKILHILCNRVLISVLSLSDSYTDFYTLGHTFRNLSDPIDE
ncbi:hypothetical protein [Serratia fonticola]|uniref:hypothetical protein n=1 Tax=Serratia fonticola TaxID=47917 RepID=UPI0015C61335|nr:hypothetical protein [Serratia fonticola]NYA45625.1 hypothetical protein [Serratia fonticola]CAI0756060.1 Uncharacterised protein [Serratia fonticola]